MVDLQGVAQLLRNLTPLVQQGNLREQLEDVIDDKYTNEVSSHKQLLLQLYIFTSCSRHHKALQDSMMQMTHTAASVCLKVMSSAQVSDK